MPKPTWWEDAKEEVIGILIGIAKKKPEGLISYFELTQRMTTAKLEPNSHLLHILLGDISREEYESGRGMLSALVVNGQTLRPGSGFFVLAEALQGLPKPYDKEKIWLEKCRFVREYWQVS